MCLLLYLIWRLLDLIVCEPQIQNLKSKDKILFSKDIVVKQNRLGLIMEYQQN